MNRTLAVIREWINPDWARHRTVPPMEAGLRPNRRLDEAHVLLPAEAYTPDDLVLTESGTVMFSSEESIFELRGDEVRVVAALGGKVGVLVPSGSGVVAAVEGVGLVSVGASGETEELCADRAVSSCVTDAARLPDGSLLVTIGSSHESPGGWARALLRGDRSGRIVRVDGPRVRIEAEGLGWPAGIEVASDTDVLVSLSCDHRIERRMTASLGKPSARLAANLPVYPGRIAATDDGWWFVAPYPRNRFTELLLDEPQLASEMMRTIAPEDWFVPRLRCTTPYTDTLQMGQLRVLGVIKPWAPARSYGLAFRLDGSGRVAESLHSRVDGERHGITGVAVRGGRVVVAAQGYRNLLQPQVANEKAVTQ
ncbi:hypothetical protein GCM10010377_75540 [Streptomyces viridiviolaceus]|uniref:Strictosidine synthase n=1 Tax=Streptomyces viridiviolaceus TaxID=68282 RepID=A0ABW2EE95_9ACTN|nr:hypothetical protein [Streptomyces viridiviolaceus]GHB73962.1 hypothetical protein GCM10010377_75540 [Streptomyces viridiviolaceus]